ncbi:MAG: ATP-dependent zinc metalloprotease FtsH [Dehalococcoidia bacterium]|nr:ATP-dependent zinc metalloprotease FtsH [Dehalococcoidia bacterium]
MAGDTPAPQPALRPGTLIVIALVTVSLITLLFFIPSSEDEGESVGLGELLVDARLGRVTTLSVKGTGITATYVDPATNAEYLRSSEVGENVDLAALLRAEGIAISRTGAGPAAPAVDLVYAEDSGWSLGAVFAVVISILPILLLGLFIWLIFRQGRGAGSQALGFSKSHARLVAGDKIAVTFDDVAGVDEAKEELAEVVEFLQHQEKFAALGARIPKGILLLGPPGTGKTLLARAVAGEAGVPFFSISGSEFVELYVGVGAGRVRDLFEQAKKNAPCIVFLDEIDAVGRQRGTGLGGSHDEREQTLNQILVEMDGFEPGTNVVVIAATNRPDILDPALIRPGRFDRKVVLDAPDIKGRDAILRVHLRGKPVTDDVSPEHLARTTPGFTGADLANLVNEAAILAARRDKQQIGMDEFIEAVDRVLAGPERKSRLMTPHERELVAYHEGGHVVVAHFLEHHDRPEKVTIVSRGVAAGFTRFLPEEETHFKTAEMFKAQLSAALGGHAAEELVFGTASTGPSNDLEQVSRIARAMVTRWGMSERLGPLTFGRTEELVFLGREISETRNYSEATAEAIDAEVRALVEEARERAREVLTGHRDVLDRLAATLLEQETLQGDALTAVLEGTANGQAATPAPERQPAAPARPAASALPPPAGRGGRV